MSETKPLLPFPPPDEARRIATSINRLVRILAYPREADGGIPLVPRYAPAGTDEVLFAPADMIRGMVSQQAQALASLGYFVPDLDRQIAEAELSSNPHPPPLDPFVAPSGPSEPATDTHA